MDKVSYSKYLALLQDMKLHTGTHTYTLSLSHPLINEVEKKVLYWIRQIGCYMWYRVLPGACSVHCMITETIFNTDLPVSSAGP